MGQKKETTFKESVDLMYDRAVETLNLPNWFGGTNSNM